MTLTKISSVVVIYNNELKCRTLIHQNFTQQSIQVSDIVHRLTKVRAVHSLGLLMVILVFSVRQTPSKFNYFKKTEAAPGDHVIVLRDMTYT